MVICNTVMVRVGFMVRFRVRVGFRYMVLNGRKCSAYVHTFGGVGSRDVVGGRRVT